MKKAGCRISIQGSIKFQKVSKCSNITVSRSEIHVHEAKSIETSMNWIHSDFRILVAPNVREGRKWDQEGELPAVCQYGKKKLIFLKYRGGLCGYLLDYSLIFSRCLKSH